MTDDNVNEDHPVVVAHRAARVAEDQYTDVTELQAALWRVLNPEVDRFRRHDKAIEAEQALQNASEPDEIIAVAERLKRARAEAAEREKVQEAALVVQGFLRQLADERLRAYSEAKHALDSLLGPSL